MGEYVKTRSGDHIKAGTCEDLYYLRADQMKQLAEMDLSRHDIPLSVEECGNLGYRFRFPFPDEDLVRIGEHDPFNRGLPVPQATFDDVPMVRRHADHGTIFLQARPDSFSDELTNYQVSLPCPHGNEASPVRIRNERSQIEIVAQRFCDGDLMTVIRCAACRSLFRIPYGDACGLAVRLRNAAARETAPKTKRTFYNTVADRMLAGYREGCEDAAAIEEFETMGQ